MRTQGRRANDNDIVSCSGSIRKPIEACIQEPGQRDEKRKAKRKLKTNKKW